MPWPLAAGISAARQAGVPSAQLAAEMSDAYVADTEGLGLGRPDHEPKASEFVPGIVALIRVPWPGRDSMVTSPPTAATRSCMLVKPTPRITAHTKTAPPFTTTQVIHPDPRPAQ